MSANGFSIGIIGAGSACIELMRKLVDAEFVNIVGVADMNDAAPGMQLARDRGIPTTNDFMTLFDDDAQLDIVIDVTGVKVVRDKLRSYMQSSGNTHTVIMHERISALLVSLSNGKLVEMKDSDHDY